MCAVKFSEVAASVVHALMEFLGESNNPALSNSTQLIARILEQVHHKDAKPSSDDVALAAFKI